MSYAEYGDDKAVNKKIEKNVQGIDKLIKQIEQQQVTEDLDTYAVEDVTGKVHYLPLTKGEAKDMRELITRIKKLAFYVTRSGLVAGVLKQGTDITQKKQSTKETTGGPTKSMVGKPPRASCNAPGCVQPPVPWLHSNCDTSGGGVEPKPRSTEKYVTKDSGHRRHFDTGAVRDRRAGKGRFDLLSPIALRRLAGVMERGATKYGDHNWEKGMPFSCFVDSALRHINQFISGKDDEDHLAQAAFNIFALIHFSEAKPELNDLPFWKGSSYEKKEKG